MDSLLLSFSKNIQRIALNPKKKSTPHKVCSLKLRGSTRHSEKKEMIKSTLSSLLIRSQSFISILFPLFLPYICPFMFVCRTKRVHENSLESWGYQLCT